MDIVDAVEQIRANVLRFDSYRTSARERERQFYEERLRLGKIFVVVRHKDDFRFCPSRFAGYANNTMLKHWVFDSKDGSVTTPKITRLLGQAHEHDPEAEAKYLELCAELRVEPSTRQRTYWSLKLINPLPIVEGSTDEDSSGYPDQVLASDLYPEGAVKQVLVNAYERNPKARTACIEHYGAACVICAFDFEQQYGVIGSGFIHVHHINPLAMQSGEYSVNPIEDLRPVCPNCHAMLHKSSPPFSIDELKELLIASEWD